MKKQTAANNQALARIKLYFNEATYKEASRIMNAEGRDACMAYIGKLFSDEHRVSNLIGLFGK